MSTSSHALGSRGRQTLGYLLVAALALLTGASLAGAARDLAPAVVGVSASVLVLVMAWLVVRDRLFWLLAAGVLFLPLTTVRALGGVGNISDLLFLIVLLGTVAKLTLRPAELARLLHTHGLGVPLLGLAAAGIASSINAVDQLASVLILLKVLFALWVLPNLIALTACSERRLRQLAWTFVLAASLASLAALSDFALGTTWQQTVTGTTPVFDVRYAGLTGHPNLLGLTAALGAIAVVGLLATSSRTGPTMLLSLIILSICIGGIFASGSLTAIAALVPGTLAALWLAGRRRAFRSFAVAATLAASVAVAWYVMGTRGELFLISRLASDPLSAESATERETINSWAIDQIRDDPFVGHGLDQVGTGPTHSEELPAIHNLWLQMWYTGGILALASMALYYVRGLILGRLLPGTLLAPFGAMAVGWLVATLSISDVYSRLGLFGFLGIVAGSIVARRQGETGFTALEGEARSGGASFAGEARRR